MKRRELTHEELEQVIKLKQFGTSWLRIEHDMGISRRIAKRAYEKWEQSKSMEELKEARKDVAAQAFREHKDSLVKLSASLVANLSVPPFLDSMEKNAEQFFSWLYQQDLLQRGDYPSPEPVQVGRGYFSSEIIQANTGGTPSPHVEDMQSRVLEHQLLLKSLKEHTREKVKWEVLKEWERSRDKCAKIVPKLRRETPEVVDNLIKQEREANFLQRIKEDSEERNLGQKMAEVALRHIWNRILQDKLDEEGPWFETVLRTDRRTHVVYVKPKVEIVLGFTDKTLAEKITRICNLATDNLRRGKSVNSLKDEVFVMEKVANELREALNPVKLTPMILRSRCELCPA